MGSPETVDTSESMDTSENKLPLHEDIMQLARLGEIGPIQTLLDEGKATANFTDAENITPLHVCSSQGSKRAAY